MTQIEIETDGTPPNTVVKIDGEEVKDCTAIKFSMAADELATATIEFVGVAIKFIGALQPTTHRAIAVPLGPPFCDVPCPDAGVHEEGIEPIRCGYKAGHVGPHGWDLDALEQRRREERSRVGA